MADSLHSLHSRILGIDASNQLVLNGTAITSTAAELNALDITAAGTAQASKAVVLDSSKGISTITSATITTLTGTTANLVNVDAGASGTAGTVDIFPTTAANGKLILSATDAGGAYNTTITNAAQGQSTVVSVPDPGASTADFVLNKGNQSIAGVKTLTGTLAGTAVGMRTVVRQSADVVKDDGAAAGALTGLVHTLVAGTYAYRANIQCLSTANGGAKVTFALTTAALTSLQNVATAFTASGVAQARSTTATSGATLYGATAAITQIVIEGTMVVSTGGTIQLQGEQNASHADESTFYTGSTFEIHRIS